MSQVACPFVLRQLPLEIVTMSIGAAGHGKQAISMLLACKGQQVTGAVTSSTLQACICSITAHTKAPELTPLVAHPCRRSLLHPPEVALFYPLIPPLSLHKGSPLSLTGQHPSNKTLDVYKKLHSQHPPDLLAASCR